MLEYFEICLDVCVRRGRRTSLAQCPHTHWNFQTICVHEEYEALCIFQDSIASVDVQIQRHWAANTSYQKLSTCCCHWVFLGAASVLF